MIRLAYASFGRVPPEFSNRGTHALVWIFSAIFVITGLAITLLINFFSLTVGVLITFLGKKGMSFRYFFLFRHIPMIAVSLPVLLGYAIWHQGSRVGYWNLVWPALATLALAILILLALGVINRLLNR